ncbi:MAG: hypothetical protein DCC71_14600 [Proteobacteria bacterium]|nr:MAG: hypothetical protein DCC71_14600 [Pseudomonadota bacterium]
MAGRAGAWGYVRLVPREGVETGGGSRSYGDREVADAALVDYSKPGFAVVYAEGAAPAATPVRVAIADAATGPAFDPPHAALGAGGAITVANASAAPHVVSCPRAGLVRRLAPGESVEIAARDAGEWPLFLLDAPGEQANVFAAPGAFQVVSAAGRFAFADLAQGAVTLRAWHPRFPPAARAVTLAAGGSTRVDLELRVDRPAQGAGGAP